MISLPATVRIFVAVVPIDLGVTTGSGQGDIAACE